MENVILIRYGEIFLKGLNRPFFEKSLIANIKGALQGFQGAKVIKGQGRIYVENIDDVEGAMESLRSVFGIVSLSAALKVDKSMESLQNASRLCIKKAIESRAGDEPTFKVESRRADKSFPLNSMELSREMGAFILRKFPSLKVDVHNPDITLSVEIRENAYVYSDIIAGAGGMPVGTNGKATLLLSGGIDSPVAGWMIAKRGVKLSAVYYHSVPYTSDRAKQKVVDLAKAVSKYSGNMDLYVVPFTKIQREIYQHCPDAFLTVLMRRFMMKIAESIAIESDSKALITGESVGQVASQTLESLAVTDDAVNMPVLRPLVGFDKVEIMDIAKDIKTYDISILPYEDCCTVFVPRHPVTRPKLKAVIRAENLIDGESLMSEALENVELIKI
ncbi:MAG: tRNA 4-thiouridine(8) synthase ThiI [Clostridiales bacterium]|nr:tRNA 4-thiouridine(8) synthase ThiI [Clostridiales bacterium]